MPSIAFLPMEARAATVPLSCSLVVFQVARSASTPAPSLHGDFLVLVEQRHLLMGLFDDAGTDQQERADPRVAAEYAVEIKSEALDLAIPRWRPPPGRRGCRRTG